MSDFFLHENILIKYWVDQCSKYELHGNKIKSAIANIPLSITPDIKENLFEDGTKQPCEIKWTTSGFSDPDQISKVTSMNGFLLVFKKDKLDCPIPQIEIDRNDFEIWFQKNSKKLASETTKKFSNNKISKEPVVFLNYLSTRKSGKKNWETAIANNTWGVNEKDFEKSNKLIKNVKKGDIIIFFYEWRKDPKMTSVKGGRIPLDKFQGTFTNIFSLIVTKDYYYSNTPEIWKDKDYPHRFKFKHLFSGADIKCNKRNLGVPLHSLTHRLMSNPRFIPIDSSMMLKVISLCTK